MKTSDWSAIASRIVTGSRAASNGAQLVYDPLGRLFQTSGGVAGVTQFLYDGDQLAIEYDGAGNVRRRYGHGFGEDDPIVWQESGSVAAATRRFLFPDQQGSIVAITDASGNQVAINRYDEYGIPGATNLGRFQYTGQAWLPELGMYYYKARIYSPTLGRFLQTDPIGYADQNNLYAYVANDPVNSVDPSGECTGSLFGNSAGECTTSSGVGPRASDMTAAMNPVANETKRNGPKSTPGKANGSTVFVNDQNGSHRTSRLGALAECTIHEGGCSRTVAGTLDGKVLYRAGRFKVRDSDVVVDPRTGFLLGTAGVSVNTNPNAMSKMHTFGIPPAGIGIIRDGGTHYMLVPNRDMTREEFDSLIDSMNPRK